MLLSSVKTYTKYTISAVTVSVLLLQTTPVYALTLGEATSTVGAFFTSLLTTTVQSKDANSFPVSEDRPVKKTITVRLSFYSSEPRQTDSTPCVPADGSDLCLMAQDGVVDAIAANFLPLGTQVRFKDTDIEGLIHEGKIFTVRDRMNARYNDTRYVDVYVAVLGEDGKVDMTASRERARQLGVKYVEMEVF